MADVIYLIVFASFALIVVNGHYNVSEQLREIQETLEQRDALYQQQQDKISGITDRLRRHADTTAGDLSWLEDEQNSVITQLKEVKEFLQLEHLPRNCVDIQIHGQTRSGVYTLYVGRRNKPLQVYCDLKTDGGGWLVFQRRQDGSVDFYRNWTQYESGFGNLRTEFWLGNTNLHSLTSDGNHQLRVDMESFRSDEKRFAVYDSFSVGSTEDKYVLRIGAYQGTAGDALAYSNGWQFSTLDQDNDRESELDCASECHGAGWYKACSRANPNGLYYNTGELPEHQSIFWLDFQQYYPMKVLEMKFRPSDF